MDNPQYELYQSTVEGHNNRFKLRIRSYSDDPEVPVFFEIKRRANLIILKSRATVSRAVAGQFLAGDPVPSHDPAFEEFVQSCQRMNARPILRVRYDREAYESCGKDPVRVTIDHDVRHAITRGPNLSVNDTGWVRTPSEGVILEIKFTDRAPDWVHAMVRALDLERTSIAKYVLSLDRAFSTSGQAGWGRSVGGWS